MPGMGVYQAPRPPIDRLTPLLLRFARKPGRSRTRRVKRRGMVVLFWRAAGAGVGIQTSATT